MTWNPDQYHLFSEARSAPARDLQAMLPQLPYRTVVDLGCGTGEQTLQLAQRFAGAQVLGLDSSAEMLSKAAELTAPNLRFEQRDIAALEGHYEPVVRVGESANAEDRMPSVMTFFGYANQITLDSRHHYTSFRSCRR